MALILLLCTPVSTTYKYLINSIQGYFCDGTCRNAIPDILSQDVNWNSIPETFSWHRYNTSPSPNKFWVTTMFWNLFSLEK
jgi:hypothetical protein